MQTIENKEAALSGLNSRPSLLRQIIDEIDELATEKKEELLWKIKMEKALLQSQKADEAFKDQFQNLSDKDIADLVSRNRKESYEEKVHY